MDAGAGDQMTKMLLENLINCPEFRDHLNTELFANQTAL